jgi:NADH-quinone oxidoreductase subunit C
VHQAARRCGAQFSTLIDLIGIDYQGYHGWEGARYAVVYNLLSIHHNFRVRIRCFCANEDFPRRTR